MKRRAALLTATALTGLAATLVTAPAAGAHDTAAPSGCPTGSPKVLTLT